METLSVKEPKSEFVHEVRPSQVELPKVKTGVLKRRRSQQKCTGQFSGLK